MSEHAVMGFGRKANIPVVQETTMDTDGIGGDDIVTPPGIYSIRSHVSLSKPAIFPEGGCQKRPQPQSHSLPDPTVSFD